MYKRKNAKSNKNIEKKNEKKKSYTSCLFTVRIKRIDDCGKMGKNANPVIISAYTITNDTEMAYGEKVKVYIATARTNASLPKAYNVNPIPTRNVIC